MLKVEKVMGLHTPAGSGGLRAGDVLIEVGGRSVIFLTHAQFVDLVKSEQGKTLKILVERGDHIVPNIQECFPIKTETELSKMTDEERLAYYEEAMRRGLGSRLGPNCFTTVGKMKVKVPKYNCPRDLYSDTTMDEMISGTSQIDPTKLDPDSPAYEKYKKSKKFDPSRSSVLTVLHDHENGIFAVDSASVVQARQEMREMTRKI